MEVLRQGVEADRERWLRLWRSWPDREVFAHPDYLGAFASRSGGEPVCLVHQSRLGNVIYPLFLRQIEGGSHSDIVSPYGYGGPFFWSSPNVEQLVACFWREFDQWAREQSVVSEFARLALSPADVLDHPGEVSTPLMNVVRSLEPDEESLWYDVKHKVRKNVKRAQRDGLSVSIDPGGSRLDEFLRVYTQTMSRCGADAGYFFDRDFFDALNRLGPSSVMYFHAMADSVVVATELILVSQDAVYSFLGGTDSEHFASRPNDLLKWEICRWAKAQGKSRFVLGGGKTADDGIYQYKLAFAPEGAVPFRTARRIHDRDAYDRLVTSSGAAETSFFPRYRSPDRGVQAA